MGPPNAPIIPTIGETLDMIAAPPKNELVSARGSRAVLAATPGAADAPEDDDALPGVAARDGAMAIGGARMVEGNKRGMWVYEPSGAEKSSGGRLGCSSMAV